MSILQSSSRYTSFDDVSTGGTVVVRGQHDESDNPRTPKSRLGIQEKTSSAPHEDSAVNLAEVCQYSLFGFCMVRALPFH